MAKRAWDLVENTKNKRWFLQLVAKTGPNEYPTVAGIRERAGDKGIDANYLLSDAMLEKNIQKALSVPGEEFSFPIVIEPSFDTRLIISADKLKAFLYIRKSADKKVGIDLKLVSILLNNSQIKGMNPASIKSTLNEFRTAPAMELNDFLIAEGTPPGRGKNRELLAKVEWIAENETKQLHDKLTTWLKHAPHAEGGKVAELGESAQMAYVVKDQIVYELSPAEQGSPGTDIYGKEIPGLPGNDPFIQIIENLTLGPPGLKAAKTGLLIADTVDETLQVRIIPYLDGKTTPVIPADKLTASLILEAGDGAGTALSSSMALAALEKIGVRGKIDTALIEATVADVNTTKKSTEIVVLRGDRPVLPGSSRVSWFVSFSPLTNSANVNAGDSILSTQKIPAGADGLNVFGIQIKAASAEAEIIPAHDETVSEQTDGPAQIYIAAKSGELALTDGKLTISDTRELTADIDDASGDLDFPGNLVLTGNVKKGRIVKAAGSLSITGDAEAALVSADESVTMKGGIRGAGRGTVWAKHAIALTFAENARILAGQDISIDNYCFQCTVKTNGMLKMKGNPAVLLGSTVYASKGVEVFELGSAKTIRTSISFGQNYLVSDQIEVCEKEVAKIEETVAKIDGEMKKLSSNDPRIHELRRKKLEMLKRNDKLTVRIFTLKEQFETHVISHISVENTVYPGVILESHGRYYEVREPKNHVIFVFDQKTGQITCSPLDRQ